ncbi:hypothetical protein ACO2RV_11340 [Ancylobacter sp. VNQ12]|uniref:hypothetical protein n=1 Tax=Ancylobacter sp. VNQ12 TaxID=3400920 RepID=UPI003C103E04
MNALPWFGYIAVYVGGAIAGFIAAALSCAASKNGLLEELGVLRKRNDELEAQLSELIR